MTKMWTPDWSENLRLFPGNRYLPDEEDCRSLKDARTTFVGRWEEPIGDVEGAEGGLIHTTDIIVPRETNRPLTIRDRLLRMSSKRITKSIA